MTDKQRQVLDQVHELLTEHFDSHVYVVNIEDESDEGDNRTCGGYSGGSAMAIGLCEHQITILKHQITHPQNADS